MYHLVTGRNYLLKELSERKTADFVKIEADMAKCLQ
jgi:hypothetical protein